MLGEMFKDNVDMLNDMKSFISKKEHYNLF
jgi:hypothetical protein